MFIFAVIMTLFFRILPFLLFTLPLNIRAQVTNGTYSEGSVLSSGKWFKLAVTADGIYRIDYARIKQLGLDNPSDPRIFGNNYGQLSFYNDDSGPDDLKELAIFLSNGNDDVFNEGDYLLFYGRGTDRWVFNQGSGEFDYKKHYYSDTAYYFITSGTGNGKRVTAAIVPDSPPGLYSSSSDALFIHETDAENLIKSGREWFQPVSYLKDTETDPEWKNIITTEPLKYSLKVLARSQSPTQFRLSSGGTILATVSVPGVNMASTTGTYAQSAAKDGEATPQSSGPKFSISFLNNGETSARGWIDYLRIEGRRTNSFDGHTTHFTDSRSVMPGTVAEFIAKSTVEGVSVWDVTDPFNARSVSYVRSGDEIRFRADADSLRTFVAFTGANAPIPLIIPDPVANQDLHSSGPADMVIVTHPVFKNYASGLAELHAENSGLTSLVVTPEQIYNEFSGGIPDIAAIRNFLRMKYIRQKGTSSPLRYLLLFGDGSFENKTPPPGNPNYVPTWQSQNSTVIVSSFASDDFYGLLEEGEGEDSGTEDLGIGRLPVSDTVQAGIILSKIAGYLDPVNTGNWKNTVTIIADDEDGNTHISDAEGLADLLTDSVAGVNIDKIYFDAFSQVTSATGQFYPGVSQAINDRINAGTLIFDYIGHGNENSLGHERVLTEENIEAWKNRERLPLFITATCEFSRFDDIDINTVTHTITERSSAGEKILFKSGGGGIALMSTTRLVYSAPNYQLNRSIFDVAFESDADGRSLRMGDIIRIAKNRSGSGTNKRNFVLLGDPAVRLAYPMQGKVITDSINNIPVSEALDTLKALSRITVTGHIEDASGNLLGDFNGTVVPIVYDKPSVVETLANDGGPKMEFKLQNNILFSGKTMANNGKFSFTFIVPRDIDYTYGAGKISYYATGQGREMNGDFSKIVAGGFSNISDSDTTGPEIKLFFNDTLFRDGGITDPGPRLYAIVADESGINTTGSGLGHDLVCWLDNDRNNFIVLNNFFEHDAGSSSRGRLFYRFSDITEGSHTLTMKAWDNYNNSTEEALLFLVETGDDFILKNLLNFPNPFHDETRISVEHNRPDDVLTIILRIYSLDGRLIRIIETISEAQGYRLDPVLWDGNDSGGAKAGRGIYPYSVTITAGSGETISISGKMIIY